METKNLIDTESLELNKDTKREETPYIENTEEEKDIQDKKRITKEKQEIIVSQLKEQLFETGGKDIEASSIYDKIEKKDFNGITFYVAEKNGKIGILNSKKEIQGDFIYDKFKYEGQIHVFIGKKEKILYPAKEGTDKIMGPFDEIPTTETFFYGYPEVINEGKYGICNRAKGEYAIPMNYDSIKCLNYNKKFHDNFEGIFKVKLGKKYGLYQIKGNNAEHILQEKYDEIKYLGDNKYELNSGGETKTIEL